MMKGIKGSICYPVDNSYSIYLDNNDVAMPAGWLGKDSKGCLVLGDPYMQEVLSIFGNKSTQEFVNIQFEGRIVRVLNHFYDDLAEMLRQKINERYNF